MSKTLKEVVNNREIFQLRDSDGKVFGYQVDQGRAFSTLAAARKWAKSAVTLTDGTIVY